jgi:hypothetical protein
MIAAFHALPLKVARMVPPTESGNAVTIDTLPWNGASKTPFVTTRVPVAPPVDAVAENAKVPAMRVVVSVVIVMVPAAPDIGVNQTAPFAAVKPANPPLTLTASTPNGYVPGPVMLIVKLMELPTPPAAVVSVPKMM